MPLDTRVRRFHLVVVPLGYLAVISATLLHELGHLCVGMLLGGASPSLTVGVLGSGSAGLSWTKHTRTSAWRAQAMRLGGIGAGLVCGAGSLAAVGLFPAGHWQLLLALYGAASLIGNWAYLTVGLHNGYGDPYQFLLSALPKAARRRAFGPDRWDDGAISHPLLAAALPLSFLTARRYFSVQRRYLSTPSRAVAVKYLVVIVMPYLLLIGSAMAVRATQLELEELARRCKTMLLGAIMRCTRAHQPQISDANLFGSAIVRTGALPLCEQTQLTDKRRIVFSSLFIILVGVGLLSASLAKEGDHEDVLTSWSIGGPWLAAAAVFAMLLLLGMPVRLA